MQKFVIFVKKNLNLKMLKIKKNSAEYRGVVHSICNLKYSIPKKISLVFRNESNYDYHFIVKELVK